LHFGHKFVEAQTRRLAGERVYRQPFRLFRNTNYKSLTELFASFNFSQLVQSLQVLPNHLRRGQIVASAEYTNAVSGSTFISIGRRAFSQTVEFLQTIWSLGEASLPSPWPRAATLNNFETRMLARFETRMPDRFERRTRDRFETRMLDRFETRILDRTFTLTNTERSDRRRTLTRERNTLTTESALPNVLSRFSIRVTRIINAEAKSPPPQLGFGQGALLSIHKVAGERWPGAPAPPERESITSALMSPQLSSAELQVRFAKRFGFERAKGVNSESRPLARTAAVDRQSLRTLTKQFTLVGSPWQLGTKVFERFTVMPAAAEEARKLRLAAELVGRSKDHAVAAPPLGFVFAQPFRQSIAEERAEKKVEPREIVELVKKELEQTMAREAPLASLTGEDYAEISDRVYSSLARRLTVERERLGLR
jgi:hypothetical protein